VYAFVGYVSSHREVTGQRPLADPVTPLEQDETVGKERVRRALSRRSKVLQ
jgi:hypothetical protein